MPLRSYSMRLLKYSVPADLMASLISRLEGDMDNAIDDPLPKTTNAVHALALRLAIREQDRQAATVAPTSRAERGENPPDQIEKDKRLAGSIGRFTRKR